MSVVDLSIPSQPFEYALPWTDPRQSLPDCRLKSDMLRGLQTCASCISQNMDSSTLSDGNCAQPSPWGTLGAGDTMGCTRTLACHVAVA